MSIASIQFDCPQMAIRKVDGTHKRTAAEPMTATIWLPDSGRRIIIPNIVIPETVVKKIGWLYWLVDACIGKGSSTGGSVTTELPPEQTTWSWSDFTMVARSIQARTSMILDDGSTWIGSVVFPDCRISNLLGSIQYAEPVIAKGVLTKVS